MRRGNPQQTLLAPVPHRQVVFTIPKRLHAYCLYRRVLLGYLARVAARRTSRDRRARGAPRPEIGRAAIRAPARHRRGLRGIVGGAHHRLHGERHREPSGTASKKEALRLLREKISAREAGKLIGRPDRVTFRELRVLAERRKALRGPQ